MYTLFVLSFLLVIYHYLLFPLIVIAVSRFCKKMVYDNKYQPTVSFIIAAYNEEKVIREKIENTIRLNYPESKMEILVVSDGSTDKTEDIIKEFSPRVTSLHKKERRGKTAALNRAVQSAKGEVIVFSDANNMFNEESIKYLVNTLSGKKVGGVSGAKKIVKKQGRESSEGDSLYWKVESKIKQAESDCGSITTGDGEIFAIKTFLYRSMDSSIINDDTEITFNILKNGYKVKYDQRAESYELASIDLIDDFHVKVRMVAGGIQTIKRHWRFLLKSIFGFGFKYFSHKILRWLAPILLIILFVSNGILSLQGIYKEFFFLQLALYLMSIVGWFDRKNNKLGNVVYIPFYFTFMNTAAFFGLIRAIRGMQTTIWRKAER